MQRYATEDDSTVGAARPMFGLLDRNAFTVLAGGNRHLYERAILTIYEKLFRSDLWFPSEAEIVRVIYDRLVEEPELWREDEPETRFDRLDARRGRRVRRVRRRREAGTDQGATGEIIGRSRQIYNRLKETGWLDESRYGLKVTVEMTAGAMRLAEFLCSVKEGPAEQLGGLVIEVKNAITAVRARPAENALGLNKAARDAAAFGRYLRTVLSALREVERQVKASDTVEGRLRHYFEDFIERVLLRDYSAITTTAHPYRHRRTILRDVGRLEDEEISVGLIAQAYLDARLVGDADAARLLVRENLLAIHAVFERIEEAFEAIQRHRARLETRLRNVVRYAGRRTGFLQRSEALLLALDRSIRARPDRHTDASALLEHRAAVVSPFLLARPRGRRDRVEGGIVVTSPPDPLLELRRRLEREHLDRLTVTPAQVSRFLERRVAPFGTADARRFRLDDLDDFLAFEALRIMVSARFGAGVEPSRILKGRFEILANGEGDVDNDWLACPGFAIRRLDDGVTLDIARAR